MPWAHLPLVGGAFLAHQLAIRLHAMFVHAERTAHTPATLNSARYEVPAPLRHALQDARVVIVDDVVNADSATRSTIGAVRAAPVYPSRWQRCCGWETAPSPSPPRSTST